MQHPREEKQKTEILSIVALLHRWGIHTLGEFAALRKEEVGKRLGAIGLQLWDRANGKKTRLLNLVPPPESFEETFEFENEIETVEPLLFILGRFLQQLSLRLGALYLVVGELHLKITFSDKSAYDHQFKIPEPTNNSEVLFRMLHTHLENFKSEFPIVAVSLQAEPTKPSSQQFNLFETPLRDPARLSETLARLTGLVGADRVGTPVLEETYRPDAFRMEPFVWQSQESVSATHPLPSCALRRFRNPLPASILLVNNKPIYLRSSEAEGQIVDKKGPYFTSGNWWDDTRWDRAEWDVELENGMICRCHWQSDGWELDGIYD